MSRGDKFLAALMGFGIYMVLGGLSGILLDEGLGVVSLATDDPWYMYAGVMLLWPLFLIKYLAIGLWLVVSSGFSLLIGA